MSDLIYYCIKENNNCPRQDECERYLDSDSHANKATLYKSACTEQNARILFIKKENINVSDSMDNSGQNTEEGDPTEQTT